MKQRRQKLILDLISEFEVETQEHLQQLLRERGFAVTQATVSRDISELGLIKGNPEMGVFSYTQPNPTLNIKFESIIPQSVIGVDSVNNMVCIKCHSGLANAACASLDMMEIPDFVGTVAGDDTIFVLMKSEKAADKLVNEIKNLLTTSL